MIVTIFRINTGTPVPPGADAEVMVHRGWGGGAGGGDTDRGHSWSGHQSLLLDYVAVSHHIKCYLDKYLKLVLIIIV